MELIRFGGHRLKQVEVTNGNGRKAEEAAKAEGPLAHLGVRNSDHRMNSLDENHSILWSCTSRFHDWTDRSFPMRLLREASAAGIIGAPDWVQLGPDGPLHAVTGGEAAQSAATIFGHAPKPVGAVYLRSGGVHPHPWRFSVVVQRFDHAEGRVEGYNIINVEFARAPFETPQCSSDLIGCFTRTHSPDDTEFAAIHPTARWESLRRNSYNASVTYDMMFAGVYWANFLGPGHLDQFDPDKLGSISAHKVERSDRGLFMVMSPNIGEAETPATESEMQQLTEVFRRARYPRGRK